MNMNSEQKSLGNAARGPPAAPWASTQETTTHCTKFWGSTTFSGIAYSDISWQIVNAKNLSREKLGGRL